MSINENNYQPKELTKPNLLIVEGKDEIIFFKELCKYLKLNNYQICYTKGVSNYKVKLRAIKNITGFNNVKSIGVIRDADKTARGALQSIKYALKKNGLPIPRTFFEPSEGNPVVRVFVLPNTSHKGMLESLLIMSIQNDPSIFCIVKFFWCLISKKSSYPTNIDKAKVQVFLATRKKCQMSLGVAAQKKYWNFYHFCFNDLIDFLKNVIDK